LRGKKELAYGFEACHTNANRSDVICYGFGNPANGLGQYTTGTFTANATTQTFAIIGANYG
jgi:hypothetical protein